MVPFVQITVIVLCVAAMLVVAVFIAFSFARVIFQLTVDRQRAMVVVLSVNKEGLHGAPSRAGRRGSQGIEKDRKACVNRLT